jgi:hypothetical protein
LLLLLLLLDSICDAIIRDIRTVISARPSIRDGEDDDDDGEEGKRGRRRRRMDGRKET